MLWVGNWLKWFRLRFCTCPVHFSQPPTHICWSVTNSLFPSILCNISRVPGDVDDDSFASLFSAQNCWWTTTAFSLSLTTNICYYTLIFSIALIRQLSSHACATPWAFLCANAVFLVVLAIQCGYLPFRDCITQSFFKRPTLEGKDPTNISKEGCALMLMVWWGSGAQCTLVGLRWESAYGGCARKPSNNGSVISRGDGCVRVWLTKAVF